MTDSSSFGFLFSSLLTPGAGLSFNLSSALPKKKSSLKLVEANMFNTEIMKTMGVTLEGLSRAVSFDRKLEHEYHQERGMRHGKVPSN